MNQKKRPKNKKKEKRYDSKTVSRSYGFRPSKIEIQDYKLGGLSKASREVLQFNGQWTALLPQDEIQKKRNVETMSCVSFGLCNQVEIMEKRIYGVVSNYADRALAIASETDENGNEPTKVYETARKILGFIPEAFLPFDESIQSFADYHSPKPLNKSYYDEGRKWLNKYELKHEWVSTDAKSLMQALQYSPLGVSVNAWLADGELYYKPKNSADNHWTLLVGYKEGEYWLVYDSYPDTDGDYIKKLKWDYAFGMVKGISLNPVAKKKCWLLSWL